MLTPALMLLGAVVLALALAARPVDRLPMSPALIYIVVGWIAGTLYEGGPEATTLEAHAKLFEVSLEMAVLASLFTVGLRLRVLDTLAGWRVALILAGPGMAVTIVLACVLAFYLLDLPWPLALLLGAIVAPTDPVLASSIQIRSEQDRDIVRHALTAEGGINDGSALPAVLLALSLIGLHELGPLGSGTWWFGLLWPLIGGAALGAALGFGLGWALNRRAAGGDPLERDELIYVGSLLLALGLARASHTSSFVLVFVTGATLLRPLHAISTQSLADRLHAFGSRCERLAEASVVLAVGVLLTAVPLGWAQIGFGVGMALLVRPLTVLLTLRRRTLARKPRLMVGWFGIRGVGSLYYLVFAIDKGVSGSAAQDLIAATLVCVAVSILLHGVSSTPLMERYQQRRSRKSTAR